MPSIPESVKAKLTQLLPDAVEENNTAKKVKVNDPARRIEFEVGDAKQPDFYPQFKTLHWDNEANFSARLVGNSGTVTENSGKLAYDNGEKIARFYEKDTGDEDGGFEFDVVLPQKPASNVLEWTIQHKELDFFYQPVLTPEEIAEGASRPENVVGSYAVYHKTKKNNQTGGKHYRTGKAFHIYRPYAEDFNGDRVWCDLNIDTQTNKMTVTVPQDFLDTASYPIIVDPTFGYTSAGGSTTSIASARESTLVLTSRRKGNGFNLAENGTLDSITAFLKKDTDVAGTYTIDLSAFINREDSAGSGSHGEVVHIERTSVAISNTTYQEYTFTAASESLVADDYVLNVLGDANDLPYSGEGTTVLDIDLAFDTNATPDLNSYETFSSDTDGTSYTDERNEDPWVDVAFFSNNKFSIYATYSLATSETATTPATNFTGSSVIESVIIQ